MSFLEVTAFLFDGFKISLLIFAVTLLCGAPLGLPIAFCSMSRFKIVKSITKVIVWVVRGIPLMLQIFIIYYVPGLLFNYQIFGKIDRFMFIEYGLSDMGRITAVLIAFTINYACYFSEIYRGGIESIPKGQYEAASVLGYNKQQTFFKIIFPQMVKRVLPPVTNEVITLVKDTSLAFVLTYEEMFTVAKQIAAAQTTIMPLFVAGVFYFIFNAVVAFAMERIEKKLSYYR